MEDDPLDEDASYGEGCEEGGEVSGLGSGERTAFADGDSLMSVSCAPAADRADLELLMGSLAALDAVIPVPALHILSPRQMRTEARRALGEEIEEGLRNAEAALEALSLADALNARERDAAAERASDPAPSPPDAGLLSVMEARAELAIRKIRPPDDDRAAAFKVRLKRARGGVWHTTASGGWYETQYASGVPPWVPDLHITPEDRKAFLGESAGDGADNIRHELHHNAGFAHFMKLKLDLKAKAKRAKKELGVAGTLGRRIDVVLDEATRRLDMARLRRAEAASGDASEEKTAGAPGLAVMMKAMGKFRKQGKAARERKAQRVPFYKAYRPGRRLNESVIVHAGDSDGEWGGGGSSDGESFGAAPKVRRFGAIRRKNGASPSRKGREPSHIVHHARAFDGIRDLTG